MVNGTSIRVAILNPQEDYARRLKGHLMAIEGVKIVGEVSDRTAFADALRQWNPDVIILDLDPDPNAALAQAGDVTAAKGASVFGLSRQSDPKLILSAMRVGMREFLPKPLDHDKLEAALRKERERIVAKADKPKGRLICVVGACGGAGATMLATNLAVELNQLCGQQVVLADLDFHFGQVAMMLDVHPEFTIADLAQSPEQVEAQLLDRALVRHETGVRVLARPNGLDQAEGLTAGQCSILFRDVQASYRYLVTDGPLRYDPELYKTLAGADLTLLVFNMTVTAVRSTGRIMEELSRAGFNLDRVGLIVNRLTEAKGGLLVEHVEQTLERSIMSTIPESWDAVSTSVNMGRPLAAQTPNSPVRQAIRQLAAKIHEKE